MTQWYPDIWPKDIQLYSKSGLKKPAFEVPVIEADRHASISGGRPGANTMKHIFT